MGNNEVFGMTNLIIFALAAIGNEIYFDVFIVLAAVFAVMTVVGYCAMGADKQKAKQHKWRTKEATLFAIAFFMGGVGTTLGMKKFRHKTKHWYFKYGMLALAVLNVLTLTVVAVLAFR